MQFEEHPFPKHVQTIGEKIHIISEKCKLSKHQLIILIIIPFIIIFGQIMSYISPDESIHNYFTSRGNLINTYFVKFSWFWTIVTYLNIIINKLRKGSINNRKFILSISRVLLITLCWYLFTQWFFGPPIMDRVFLLTGGKCVDVDYNKIPEKIKHLFKLSMSQISNNDNNIDIDIEKELAYSNQISSATCKIYKGKWEGGHDPSGHVFILTLSVCLLIVETIEFYTIEDEIFHNFFNNVITLNQVLKSPIFMTMIVVITALSMLFMTVLKYHSLGEQLAGFSVSVFALWLVNRIIELIGLNRTS